MEQNSRLRDAWLRFCTDLSADALDEFDESVSPGAVFILGSAPGEKATSREQMQFGYATEGVDIEPSDPQGWSDGGMGFVYDEVNFVMPDGSKIPMRVTAVMRDEDGTWKIVHAHFSVGVPDEVAAGQAQEWAAAPTAHA